MNQEKKYTFSEQKGKPGHCLMAQVWDEDGNSVANIKSTEEEEDATATARLFAEAAETKEQHGKMFEAINLYINGNKSLYDQSKAIDKMKSLIKEIEES